MNFVLKSNLTRMAAAALVALGAAGAANATDVVTQTTNFGLVSLPYTNGIASAQFALPSPFLSTDFFVNDYGFSIGTAGSFNSAVVTINLLNILELSDLSIRLIAGNAFTGSTPTALTAAQTAARVTNTLGSDNVGSTYSINSVALNPGNYFFEVRGRSTGLAGGSYGGAINIAAVPEPTGLLMAAAGMGMLAFGLRRKRA
jgi:hypothetical protein